MDVKAIPNLGNQLLRKTGGPAPAASPRLDFLQRSEPPGLHFPKLTPTPSEASRPEPTPPPPPGRGTARLWLAAGLMGMSALGGIAGGMVGQNMAQTAQLETTIQHRDSLSPRQATQERETAPVQARSVGDVVRQFDSNKGLYVVGQPPLNATEMQAFEDLAARHPNVYVVLVEQTGNHAVDNRTLSEGIGGSAAFQSVSNPVNGKKDGVAFFVYFRTEDGSRRINMRSESLPDQLGVGESHFASGTQGEPRELLKLYRAEVTAGKSPGQALSSVADVINGRVAEHLAATPEQQKAETDRVSSAHTKGFLIGAGATAVVTPLAFLVMSNAGHGSGSHSSSSDYDDRSSSGGSDGSSGGTW